MGECCSQQYCQCDGAGAGNVTQCQVGSYFCTTFKQCMDIFNGEECRGDLYDCCLEDTTSTSTASTSTTSDRMTTTTSGSELDCSKLCEGAEEGGTVGTCCSPQYCQCSSDGNGHTFNCPPNVFFCTTFGECMDIFDGGECDGNTFDCCLDDW